jgi:hypothetical protein
MGLLEDIIIDLKMQLSLYESIKQTVTHKADIFFCAWW